jgi:sugar phosphate isomerase/epimerase
VSRVLGNSGAPRWYDCDLDRFEDYLDHLQSCESNSAEIVLHDGDADEFTSRVHVVRRDWDRVTRRYRDRGFTLSVHGPLTPEFSPRRWVDEPALTINRYEPILQHVAEIADEQGGATLVLHALADSDRDQFENERGTAEFLETIAEHAWRHSSDITLAIELRAYRDSRRSAAATTRESVLRVVQQTSHPDIGICWDVAHDFESHIALNRNWSEPTTEFLQHVRHVHLHDLGPQLEPHYPPIVGRVPFHSVLNRINDVPIVMEVRWRMAERLGEPWNILRKSYRAVQAKTLS